MVRSKSEKIIADTDYATNADGQYYHREREGKIHHTFLTI